VFRPPEGCPTTHKRRSSSSARPQRPETDLPGRSKSCWFISGKVRRCLAAIPELCSLSATSDALARKLSSPPLASQVKRFEPHPGFASPSAFPSQGFSPPQGFTSRASLQPCFVLLPLIGFCAFRVFPTLEARSRLRLATLLTLQDGLICDRAWACHDRSHDGTDSIQHLAVPSPSWSSGAQFGWMTKGPQPHHAPSQQDPILPCSGLMPSR
jgi:hypothetical protein